MYIKFKLPKQPTLKKKTLISFYADNPALWAYGITSIDIIEIVIYWKTLYEKLLIEFVEGKFNEDDIRKEWHNLLTQYKREKQRHESSKTSGSGSSKVYIPTWTFFDEMSFADLTLDVDESLTTLGVVKLPKTLKLLRM